MREIKFRAWDYETGNPLYEPAMFYSNEFSSLELFFHNAENYYTQLEVMQYTGLLDKNGAEIYEGDIVKIEIDFGYGNQPLYGEVVFDKCGFIYRHKTEGDRALFGIDSNIGCEVIGNIYENKELLK